MVFLIALILLVVVVGYLDTRVGWPGPRERVDHYVSITEQSKTLRRS